MLSTEQCLYPTLGSLLLLVLYYSLLPALRAGDSGGRRTNSSSTPYSLGNVGVELSSWTVSFLGWGGLLLFWFSSALLTHPAQMPVLYAGSIPTGRLSAYLYSTEWRGDGLSWAWPARPSVYFDVSGPMMDATVLFPELCRDSPPFHGHNSLYQEKFPL